MKSVLFYFLRNLSRAAPLESLIHLSGRRLILPSYHLVSNEDVPHVKNLYQVRNEKLFRKDMEFFMKHYSPLDLPGLIELIKKKEKPAKNYFFLSFDDGLTQVYDVAAPVLKEMGIPATVFLNSAFIGNKDLMFRFKASLLAEYFSRNSKAATLAAEVLSKLCNLGNSKAALPSMLLKVNYLEREVLDEIAMLAGFSFTTYLQEKKPYLDQAQINTLIRDGFTIGAHSVDHPPFYLLDLQEQIRQIKESLKYIETLFSPAHQAFAFPFTDYKVGKNLFDNFYKGQDSLPDISFGGAGLKDDVHPMHLHRLPMERSLLPASQIVAQEYMYYLLKMPLGKNKMVRE